MRYDPIAMHEIVNACVIIERRMTRAVSGGLINSFCPADTGSLCALKPRFARRNSRA